LRSTSVSAQTKSDLSLRARTQVQFCSRKRLLGRILEPQRGLLLRYLGSPCSYSAFAKKDSGTRAGSRRPVVEGTPLVAAIRKRCGGLRNQAMMALLLSREALEVATA
jgi:hypothetical protein